MPVLLLCKYLFKHSFHFFTKQLWISHWLFVCLYDVVISCRDTPIFFTRRLHTGKIYPSSQNRTIAFYIVIRKCNCWRLFGSIFVIPVSIIQKIYPARHTSLPFPPPLERGGSNDQEHRVTRCLEWTRGNVCINVKCLVVDAGIPRVLVIFNDHHHGFSPMMKTTS